MRSAGSLDAIVIVKRIDAAVLDVAAIAYTRKIPLFLDLCDDIVSPRYGSNRDGRNVLHFAALAPALAAVTVPSAAMAERVREHAAAAKVHEPEVYVIPDIAETREVYDLVADFLGAARLRKRPADPLAGGKAWLRNPSLKRRKRVLWFGNSGARHSNFGIFSLLPAMPVLARLNETVPLELVVVSNSETLFRALTRNSGVPARYVPWSAEAVYDELAGANMTLLTSGDDEFSSIKSLNRTLQSLAAGVPVATLAIKRPLEFEGVLLGGPNRLETDLKECRLSDRLSAQKRVVEPAGPILRRYAPEPIAGLWERVLAASLAQAQEAPLREAADCGILFLIEASGDVDALRRPLEEAVSAGFRCEVLLAQSAADEDSSVRDALLSLSLLPRIYDKPEKLHAGALHGIHIAVVGDPKGKAAQRLFKLSGIRQTRIFAARALPDGWLPPVPESLPDKGSELPVPSTFPQHTHPDGSFALVFVVPPGSRGSLQAAICHEIGSRQPGRWRVVCGGTHLPKGAAYIFSDAALLSAALEHNSELLAGATTLVQHTQTRPQTPERVAQSMESLARATRVVFSSEADRRLWIERGLDPARTAVVIGGADPALFVGHVRGNGAVGLASPFHERQNPDLIRELVHLLPHRSFVLVGEGWREYALFEDLRVRSNFSYLAAPPAPHHTVYASFDVFLSTSRLDDGPIALLEAMMENAVPVASRTGFAPDLIRHGENGLLFDADASAAEVADLVEKALTIKADVRSTVLGHNWDSFSRAILDLVQ